MARRDRRRGGAHSARRRGRSSSAPPAAVAGPTAGSDDVSPSGVAPSVLPGRDEREQGAASDADGVPVPPATAGAPPPPRVTGAHAAGYPSAYDLLAVDASSAGPEPGLSRKERRIA